MKISNNFSAPNFTKLYTKGAIDDKMAYLSQNINTSAKYKEAFTELQTAAEGRDILLQTYGDGINVQEIDPETEKTIRYISKNNDFIEGMKQAAKKLNALNKQPETKTPRVRFPGKNTGASDTKNFDTIG